jgi:hypothetical protein
VSLTGSVLPDRIRLAPCSPGPHRDHRHANSSLFSSHGEILHQDSIPHFPSADTLQGMEFSLIDG